MNKTRSKLRLPQLEKVSLRKFSLFTANPNAEFTCNERVFCLVGANGIGKSTLLSAINFCLTGIVPDPNRAFASMEEYYRYSRDFSSRYFRGRIIGTDEDEAEITVQFRIGEFQYVVRRGLFEPDELRGFSVVDWATGAAVFASEEMPRGERHKAYTGRFVQDSGLSSFEEFAFLQHFVLTFDERRKTLFWNQDVLERALYLSFGLEPAMANQADTLRREIEAEDSKVRNRQWEISRKSKRANEILAKTQAVAGAQERYDALVGDHESISRRFDEESKTLQEIERALKDANLRLAEMSVRETSLRDEYARFFDSGFGLRPPLAQHPLTVQSIEEHTCAICGNQSEAAMSVIRSRADGATCPLCDSALQPVQGKSDPVRLRMIDEDLAQTKQATRDVHKTLEKLRAAEAQARGNFELTKGKLDEFNRQNNATITSLHQLLNVGRGDSSIEVFRDELTLLEREKQAAYELREALKVKLAVLQSTLESEYVNAERVFLPRFDSLANRFLGMPLSVQMDARAATGLNLVVSVRGHPRPLQQQLSESQRFFLDIALRMALTEHMSDPAACGTMLIDTPEGSLDIAYEKRAGDMLAMFSDGGHRIVMTANLNSSQLLLALAKRCGAKGMKLCRMMDWAELSEVQKDEAPLFAQAYQEIEHAMGPNSV